MVAVCGEAASFAPGIKCRGLRSARLARSGAFRILRVPAIGSRKLLAGPHFVPARRPTTKYRPAKNDLDSRAKIGVAKKRLDGGARAGSSGQEAVGRKQEAVGRRQCLVLGGAS